MIQKTAAGAQKSNRVFVGKGWKNTSKNGTEYLNISFDRGMEVIIRDTKNQVEYSLPQGSNIVGFPNTKREGKRDADIRLSFQVE